MKLYEIIRHIRPGAQFHMSGDTLASLTWCEKDRPAPTEEEVNQGRLELERLAYQEQRASEYPPIGDQLDAIWKGGDAMEAMRKMVMAVKAKYLKPE